jgi:hypothetical protein
MAPVARPACAGAGVALGVDVAVDVGVAITVFSWVTVTGTEVNRTEACDAATIDVSPPPSELAVCAAI